MAAAMRRAVTATFEQGGRHEGVRFVSGRPEDIPELQVKSTERVRDLGEVFTPAATVQAMLDLLPKAMWELHPSPTFLEPACGDGNFLAAILSRKLDRVGAACDDKTLPAGANAQGLAFHALEALASIYAFDISQDNVVGGTPGHEVGARTRLLELLTTWFAARASRAVAAQRSLEGAAHWILERHIQVANMLPADADGRPSGRERLPLVEYHWEPADLTVTVSLTTLGAVMAVASEETSGVLSLFGTPETEFVWSGPVARLPDAPVSAPESRVRHLRNGNGRGAR